MGEKDVESERRQSYYNIETNKLGNAKNKGV
jgi:hypothetical protein